MTQKCLITGADGLLGSHVIPLLEDYELYAVSKREKLSEIYPPNCRLIQADLTDDKCYEAFPKKIDAIIHLAQSNNFRLFPEMALDIVNVNTQSTLRLLDYAKRAGASHFIYASTGGVYQAGKGICYEEQPLTMQNRAGMYYASKLAGELFVDAYSQLMTTVVLRFFFIYGPGQREAMLIPRLVQSVFEGRPIALQGEDGLKINPIYVTEAAHAVRAALNLLSSETINIAGPEILSLKQIGAIIGDEIDRDPIFENDFSKIPLDLIANTQKMSRLLIKPEISFQEGLALYLQKRSLSTLYVK